MPGKMHLTQAEARIMAKALNAARLSLFFPSERDMLPELGRRLGGFMADGQSPQLRGPKAREPEREPCMPPPQYVPGDSVPAPRVTATKLPYQGDEQREAVYARLRGEK